MSTAQQPDREAHRPPAWWLPFTIAVIGIAVAWLLPPIAQDQAYHAFADARGLLGIANFWNVASNLPFVLVGAYGLLQATRLRLAAMRTAYLVFCVGAIGVGFGSAWYHLAPSTATLVWDRLPMTVAFMALFSMVLQDRVSVRIGALALWPLIIAGAASVAYWYWTELQGRGDLRAYGLVQFGPMLMLPLILIRHRGEGHGSAALWGMLGAYLLAKLAEQYDTAIFTALRITSGHSIKHLLGGAAIWLALRFALAPRDEAG